MSKRVALAIAVLFLLVLAPRDTLAADPLEDFPDPAAARSLVDEARALMQRKKYKEACPKLEASLRLAPGPSTQLDLADCNEHLGNLASAWRGFLDVASRLKAAKQADREKAARKRAQALEPRLPKLVVEVPNALEGLEVKRDGVAIERAAWGTAIPIDPGPHRVSAIAPGRQRWTVTVQTNEGANTHVEIPRYLPEISLVPAPTSRDVASTLDGDAPTPRDVATTLD
jgi:hypothetical protein